MPLPKIFLTPSIASSEEKKSEEEIWIEGKYYRELLPKSWKFQSYYKAMTDCLDPEDDHQNIMEDLPHANRKLLDTALNFLDHYSEIPETDDWACQDIIEGKDLDLKGSELTEWDLIIFGSMTGPEIVELLKVSEFLDSVLITTKIGRFFSKIINQSDDVKQLKDFLETDFEPTKEDEENARRDHPDIIWL